MLRTTLIIALSLALPAVGADKLKALIVDGQNNHNWKGTTPVLKQIMENSGRFTVDVSTTPGDLPRPPAAPRGQATAAQKAAFEKAQAEFKAKRAEAEKGRADEWAKWRPDFKKYDVLVMNYTGDKWPDEVKTGFADYVKGGGGLVIYHAANNAFPDWPEYNQMIAVGGWGGRNEKSGPYLRLRDGKWVHDPTPGRGGSHGPQHEFVVEAREPSHPILAGLPEKWRHYKDELYSELRGPATNVKVLASAYASKENKGSGENEPLLMVIEFGKGRVFHDALGHGPEQLSGLGFQVTFLRGAEWAATGKVTIPPPAPGLLNAEKVAVREVGAVRP